MNRPSDAVQVSIVIPALDEAGHIRDLLDDFKTARQQGHEVILVDGGSRDATAALAAADADRVIITGSGRAAQMNIGAQAAHGDILWFVHADSRVPSEALSALLDAVGNDAQWGRFDVDLSGRDWRLRIVERLMNLRSRLSGIATGDQGIFCRRDLFASVGGYAAIPLMEDIALSKTLRRRASPYCINSPHLLVSSRRWETRGITRTILLMWRLRLAYALGASPRMLVKHYR